MKHTIKALGLLAISAVATGANATEWSWTWTGGQGAAYNNAAGNINRVDTTYNDQSQRLTWKVNAGKASSTNSLPDGFYLTIGPGPAPKGVDGEYAIFYMDGTGSNPRLTVYGKSGKQDAVDSWKDGSIANSTQSPDKIKSSLLTTDWINTLSKVNEADGTRTYLMDINVSAINAHTPLYGNPNDWIGASFANKVGVWYGQLDGLSTSYSNGYLSSYSYNVRGWLDGENFSATPEPCTMIALGAGLAAFARKRRK